MERLRIALLAHIRHPIAKPFMGGMEAHAYHLANALVARGHEVTLYASGDSRTAARLRPVIPVHYDREFPWHRFHGTDRLTSYLDKAFAAILPELASGAFDVVHNNTLHRFPPRLFRRDGVPAVTSLHVPPFDVLARAVRGSAAPWARFTATSRRQRGLWWPETQPAESHVVANGIALDEWPFVETGDGSAAWSGRITPTKGAHVAIDAARALGMDITLFGAIEDRDYFDAEIAPRLGNGARYGGHLSQPDLARAIGRSTVYLFTPLWDEPFGLAAAEALACGVPVAALPNGATAEVVGPGGVIAANDSAEALALAAARASELPRGDMRRYAEAVFSMDRMVAEYEGLYARAIAARPGAPSEVAFTDRELPRLSGAAA